MGYDRHPVALLLQSFPQRDVWLDIAARADRQAYEMPRGHGQEDFVGHVYRLGE